MAKQIKDYPEISLEINQLDGKLDFEKIFGRKGPVHIEVGCGKGTFLLNQARIHKDLNFLGIEWANKYYRYCVDRMGRWSVCNVRIIRTEAAEFLKSFISEGSVECFHIYFPDPWPKKRHHKRRFFNEQNLQQMLRCLVPGGLIKIATDHAGYFGHIELTADAEKQKGTIKVVEFHPADAAEKKEYVGTNFEKKYIEEGRSIYTLALQKGV